MPITDLLNNPAIQEEIKKKIQNQGVTAVTEDDIQLSEQDRADARAKAKADVGGQVAKALTPKKETSSPTGGNQIDAIIAAKKKAGSAVTGAAASRAAQGSAIAPGIGTAIGAGVGLVEGFVKRGAAQREAEVAKKRALADIETNKQKNIQGNINSFIDSLREIL